MNHENHGEITALGGSRTAFSHVFTPILRSVSMCIESLQCFNYSEAAEARRLHLQVVGRPNPASSFASELKEAPIMLSETCVASREVELVAGRNPTGQEVSGTQC